MEEYDGIIELAARALEEVSVIALHVGRGKRQPLCGRLGGELFIAASLLDSAGAEQEAWLRRKVPKLMRDVESICTWPADGQKDYPCLREIAQGLRGSSSRKIAEGKIRQGLQALSAAREDHLKDAIAHIQRFSKHAGVAKPVAEREATPKALPLDYSDEVKALVYDTLCRHTQCTCEVKVAAQSAESRRHLAKLLLKPMLATDSDGNLQFDLLMSSAPRSDDSALCYWQDVDLQVPRISQLSESPARRVHFAGDEFRRQPPPTRRDLEEINLGNLCRLLSLRADARLCLTIQYGKLQRFLDSKPSRHIGDDSQSVSLATLLRSYHLTAKMKAALAYILAFSVWQFYDSDWMSSPWTSETIQFVRQYGSGRNDGQDDLPKFFPSRPYFSARFGDTVSSDFHEASIAYGEIHRYPRVRALGIMLVEIGLGAVLPRSEGEPGSLSETGKINKDWSLARQFSDREEAWPEFDYKNYRTAVKNSLDPGLFAGSPFAPGATDKEQADGLRKRRKILYNTVVLPLEQLLQGTGWKEELHSIGPAGTQRSDRPAPFKSLAVSTHEKEGASDGPRKERKASQRWLRQIDSLNHELASSISTVLKKRVRIAILDTGYDPDATFFHHPRRRNRLIKWKDWAEGEDQPADSHGHGTHLLALIMRIAPEADICVARVASSPASLVVASDDVAEAIEWAQGECEADIISMSFGYVSDRMAISKAIRSAMNDRNESIVMFAAAANSGANQRELFPARHESVISIRGTTSNGGFPDFNPPRNRHDGTVLGTLGLEVPSASLSSHDITQEYMSGTSVATAVAAGIAGILLGYVYGKPAEDTYHIVRDRLQTRQGMLAMFESMASNSIHSGYLYVSPWCLSGIPDKLRWSQFEAAALGAE